MMSKGMWIGEDEKGNKGNSGTWSGAVQEESKRFKTFLRELVMVSNQLEVLRHLFPGELL